jgi:hypothetical protein
VGKLGELICELPFRVTGTYSSPLHRCQRHVRLLRICIADGDVKIKTNRTPRPQGDRASDA